MDAASASWADEVCDRFEKAWSSGASPRIEDYLDTAEGSVRTHLLRELLLAELEFRLAGGVQPRAAEYLARFPADAWLVHEVFSEVARR